MNIKQNIALIQASIEKDKAYNKLWYAILTITGVLLGVAWGSTEDVKIMISIFFLIVFWLYLKQGNRMPIIAFIEKVIENIDV